MNRFWSEIVSGLEPYVPGEQPYCDSVIKLNTNESPYPPSPKVMSAIQKFGGSSLARYPDPSSRELVNSLSNRFNVPREYIFVGNGSDEILAHAFNGLLRHSAPLRFPDITYGFYSSWALLYGLDTKIVPVHGDFTISVDDYLSIDGPVVIANPNAPTGLSLALEDLERLILGNSQSVIVIDEAYVDYGGRSSVPLVKRYENLLVVQTFSKSRSLAGIRVGYAIGQPHLIEALNRIKDSFNSYPIDTFSQVAAVASLSDEPYFQKCCKRICDSRSLLTNGLRDLGFDVLSSHTNFLFVTHPAIPAATVHDELGKRNILVRYWGGRSRLSNYIRVTVGTDEDCRHFLSEVKRIVS